MAEITQEELNERVAILKRFRALLEQQRGKFKEYLNVLEKQHDSITNENTEALLAHTELEQQVVKNLLRDSDGNFVKDSDGKLVATDESAAKKGAVVFLAGGLANLVLSIWSCADAVKVAKVKNMYYQDMQSRYGLEARMYPSVDLVQTGNGVQPTAGMTFALQF